MSQRLFARLGCSLLLISTLALSETDLPKAWQILDTGLHESNADRRIRVLHALGALRGNSRAISMIEGCLKDARPEVRAAAANVLGEMKSAGSRTKLKALLSDKEVDVVLSGANALYALGDPVAFEVFYQVLTGKSKNHNSLTDEAHRTLSDPGKIAKLGLEQGIGFIPYAGAGYGALKMLLKDDASPVRGAAAIKLAKDPDPNAKQALLDALEDKKATVRTAALSALAIRNDPATKAAIASAMEDSNEVVRYTAAAAYIEMAGPRRKTP